MENILRNWAARKEAWKPLRTRAAEAQDSKQQAESGDRDAGPSKAVAVAVVRSRVTRLTRDSERDFGG